MRAVAALAAVLLLFCAAPALAMRGGGHFRGAPGHGRFVDGRFAHGHFVDGRFAHGRFVDGRFVHRGFVDGRFHHHGFPVRTHVFFAFGTGFWWPPVYPWYAVPALTAAYPAYVAPAYWYYCPSAQAYYPNVPTCPEPWVTVPSSH